MGPTDAKSLPAGRLTNLDEVISRERTARIALELELARREAQYQIGIARADAVRAMIDEQIREAALEVERARRAEASAAAIVVRLTRAEAEAAKRLADRESQFAAEVSSIAATRDRLQQQLLDVEARVAQDAEARHALERALTDVRSAAAAAEQRFRTEAAAITEHARTETAAILENARADQARLEDQLSRERRHHEIQLADEQQKHRSTLAAATSSAATRLAERERQFAAELASMVATRDRLQQQLADVEARAAQETGVREALERTITDLQSAAAAAEQRFREETSAIAEKARADRARLEDQLSREWHAHQIQLKDAQQQHRSAMADAVARLAEREAQFAAELSSITATRDSLQQQLAGVEARVAEETEARETLELSIAELRSAAEAAEHRFRDARRDHEIQLADEQQRYRSAIETAETRLADRETQFAAELSSITEHSRADRARLEEQLSRERHNHEIQLADEQQQHRSAVTAAATRLAERETQFAAELSSLRATRDGLQQQLANVEARVAQETEAREALERGIAELRSAAVAAEERFREETAAITEHARADRARLEDQLSRERHDHKIQLADEQQQHQSALANAATTAATQLAEREAQFAAESTSMAAIRQSLQQQLVDVAARLGQEMETREGLERTITELHSDAEAAEQRFREETAAIAANARADRARLDDQLSREWHAHQVQLADAEQQHRSAMAAAATRLADREEEFAAELSSITAVRDSLQQQLADVDARLVQETEARETLERAITELRSAAAAAEQRFREEIAALTERARADRTRLEDELSRERAQAVERQATYQSQIEQKIAERRRVEEALARARMVHAEAEKRLADALATRNALEKRLTDIEAELRDARSAIAAAATRLAERDAQIKEQAALLEAGKNDRAQLQDEIRRQFEDSPAALCRCTRDGSVTDANWAFAVLVGCRKREELRNPDFAATLFEAPGDLSWLIEKSVSTRRRQSVETTCRRKDGTRVAVRLTATASPSGLIEIAAEDLTLVRVLEDKLKHAHRMEAVGRLASEIAVTCRKLLGEIHRDAHRWLQTLTGSAQHDNAERLLADVTRVGSFLEQVVSYEHEQRAAPAPVDLNKVLRDLEPVLKQVAGYDVALEFLKTASPISVDATADRVERLLVNVASYGRERMPFGGRLKIELSTVVVDRKFTAQYHNVRPGPHALITVTELARSTDGERPVRLLTRESGPGEFASGRPGVDLGVLQELITDCGGHLWITAERGGSMVVKMRLPLRVAWDNQADRPRILGRIADV